MGKWVSLQVDENSDEEVFGNLFGLKFVILANL